jgi:hypothetical protein
MPLSHFGDKARPPSEAKLKTALGQTYPSWKAVQELVRGSAPTVTAEWGYASASTGWGLRLKLGKRVLLYLTPCLHHFLVSTALGEKAVALAQERGFPAKFLTLLDQAPRYAEGRGIRIQVGHSRDVRTVARLLELKLAAKAPVG